MPTLEPPLIELIRYNNWANQQVLEACQKLTAEQLAASEPGAYGTIRDTLKHIVRAESWYVELLTGSRPETPFKWEDDPDLAGVIAYSKKVADALLDAANRVNPDDRAEEEDGGKVWSYKAMIVFIQIINHGVEHRTNITTILSQHNLKPPQVDGWGYMDTHKDHFDVK